MSAFTPGPWRAEKHGLITAEVNGVRRQVASVQGDAVMHGDPSVDVVSLQQANANLIAAAPALLAALKTKMGIGFNCGRNGPNCGKCDECKAELAIWQAEGKG